MSWQLAVTLHKSKEQKMIDLGEDATAAKVALATAMEQWNEARKSRSGDTILIAGRLVVDPVDIASIELFESVGPSWGVAPGPSHWDQF